MSNYQELTLDDLSNNEEYANFIKIPTVKKLTGGLIKGCFPSCPQVFKERNKQEIEAKFGAGIPKGASCSEIDIEITKIQNEMDMIRGKITGGDKSKLWSSALAKLEEQMKDAKNRKSVAKCDEIKAKQEKEQETKGNLEALAQVTKDATATSPLSELEEKIKEKKEAKPNYTKYIAIGIAGIFVIGAIVLLLKPSKPAE